MRQLLLILLTLTTLGASAQIVNIPDANFKACLVGHTVINSNGDGEIQTTEAAAFTGILGCSNMNISDLTGIEAFTAITELYCSGNTITSLDLSQHTALGYIDCSGNQLTSLNVANGNNANMREFSFFAFNNPNLSCIQVDDVTYSDATWTFKDPASSYSTNCSLGIDDFDTKVAVSVYPNPATSQLSISSTQTITAIAIKDITGKDVGSPDFNNNSIDISYLSKGLYFLQIETTGGSVVEKFVKR